MDASLRLLLQYTELFYVYLCMSGIFHNLLNENGEEPLVNGIYNTF